MGGFIKFLLIIIMLVLFVGLGLAAAVRFDLVDASIIPQSVRGEIRKIDKDNLLQLDQSNTSQQSEYLQPSDQTASAPAFEIAGWQNVESPEITLFDNAHSIWQQNTSFIYKLDNQSGSINGFIADHPDLTFVATNTVSYPIKAVDISILQHQLTAQYVMVLLSGGNAYVLQGDEKSGLRAAWPDFFNLTKQFVK